MRQKKNQAINSVLTGFYLDLENLEDLPNKQLQIFSWAWDETQLETYIQKLTHGICLEVKI